jgi:Arc/MetJ-type ribon-helix-helix transcriptional regulator
MHLASAPILIINAILGIFSIVCHNTGEGEHQMSITLTPDLESIIKEQVENGNFPNPAAFIRTTIENYFASKEDEYEFTEEQIQDIKQAIQEIEDGTAVLLDADEVFVELDRKYP